MHPRAVVVAEPLQVLLCVCAQDRALQFSVYCGIAEERKVEQIVRMNVPEETGGVLPIWPQSPQCSKSGLRVIQDWVMKRLQCRPEFSVEADALNS